MLQKQLLVILYLWTAVLQECGLSGGPKAIINGSTATWGQFPWMVKLTIYFPYVPDPAGCGGSIITRRHVLTAAHCIRMSWQNASRVYVLYGHNDVKQAKRVPADRMMAHPRFQSLGEDIGLVRVKRPFQFSEGVRPICLPTRRMNFLGRHGIVAGWGQWKQGDPTTSDYLQYAVRTIVEDDVCKAYFLDRYNPRITLCGRDDGNSDCMGDSGGPLFVEFKRGRFMQAGIVSYGIGNFTHCGPFLNAYMRVDAYLTWIKNIIAKFRDDRAFEPHQLLRNEDPTFVPYIFSFDDTE